MTPATNTGDTFFLLETASGRFLNLESPDPADICLEDIAQGLARTTRFRGQARTFCSVAEHAVLVADQLEAHGAPPEYVLAGLHHDDSEAFLGDVPTPLKRWIGDVWREMEYLMDTAICKALGLPFGPDLLHHDDVKHLGAAA